MNYFMKCTQARKNMQQLDDSIWPSIQEFSIHKRTSIGPDYLWIRDPHFYLTTSSEPADWLDLLPSKHDWRYAPAMSRMPSEGSCAH